MNKLKILFVTHELSPFLEGTKTSRIVRELAQAMQERGAGVRILMPRFGNINERRNRLHEVIRLSGMNIVINENDNPLVIKVASIPVTRMQVYFLDNEEYFQRKYVFRDKEGKFYDDNDERMIFFCRGVLETIKKLSWSPDVIHCHNWMGALIPAYVKTQYKDEPIFKNSKVVYSVYENQFDEQLCTDFVHKIVMGDMLIKQVQVFKDANNDVLHIGAIQYADGIVLGNEDLGSNILNALANSNKPILDYGATASFENYYNFYEEILSEELVLSRPEIS